MVHLSKASAFATLLVKNGRDDARTIANISPVPNTENNLADWFVRLEITNTGVSKTNNGILILRLDALGTFIRTGPILVNEATKNSFLIELQIKQDLDNDGDFSEANEKGMVLRAIIGQPQISINESFGEVLTLALTGIEYRLKESPTSEWHLFLNPNESFGRRLTEVSATATGIRFSSITNTLPTTPRISVKPAGAITVHETLTNIIDDLSLPSVAGGSFDDFYFDIEPSTTLTNNLTIIAERFGKTSTGVTIDPLASSIFDAEEENTTVTDNIEYKNNVILTGTSTGGSLPVERTRFASGFEHARIRDVWSGSSISYSEGDLVKHKTTTALKPHLVTYHKALIDHTSAPATDPLQTHGTLWEQDFTTYPNFVTASNAFYKQGEIVSVTSGGTVNFYQANKDGTHPTPASANWNFLLGFTEASYTAFVSYTPWTNDVDLWKETLAGRAQAQALSPKYEGWAFDWNVTKANYNREDLDNHFEPISAKIVHSLETAQPASTSIKSYDTQRYLLSATPTGADWSGNGNKVAELDGNGVTGKWVFSNAPVNSDMVNDLGTGTMLKFNGTIWGTQWNGTAIGDTDKPSPFHICKNVGLIAGATGISGQAVEFLYDWTVNVPINATTHFNRTSRGAWISNSFPFPRIDTTNFKTGELFGGQGGTITPSKGTLDTNNLDTNHKGLIGYNQGLLDEDMGRISAFAFKMRVSMFRNSAGTSLVEGQPDVPMIFWTADKFDRIWFARFKLRRNGQWDPVRIAIGDLAPNSLYFARWDELAKLNGVVITELDFTLSEKEFSGVQFDWREMKHWGVQLAESYVDTGLYKNGYQRAIDFTEDVSADAQANWYWYTAGPAITSIKGLLPQHTPVTQNLKRFSVKIAIDDLHFEKEQVANSDDVTLADPRTSIEHLSTENDYLNLKDRAIARQARHRFFPQIWHIRSTGDVRLKFGQSFTVTGSRVPEQASQHTAWNILTSYVAGNKVSFGGFVYQAKRATVGDQPDTNEDDWDNLNRSVIAEVKHIYDHDGYHCEVSGFRKFTVSG